MCKSAQTKMVFGCPDDKARAELTNPHVPAPLSPPPWPCSPACRCCRSRRRPPPQKRPPGPCRPPGGVVGWGVVGWLGGGWVAGGRVGARPLAGFGVVFVGFGAREMTGLMCEGPWGTPFWTFAGVKVWTRAPQAGPPPEPAPSTRRGGPQAPAPAPRRAPRPPSCRPAFWVGGGPGRGK